MHCGAARLTHHQNKHVDYIIKTKKAQKQLYDNCHAINHSADSTVHPACGDAPRWVVLFASCNMRLIVRDHIIFYVIIHLIRTVNCFPTSDGQHTER